MSTATNPLASNSFAVLGATARDSRRRILELAEEHALTDDAEAVGKARAELTHPRARLSAEMAWLPGVSPKRVAECLALLKDAPAHIFELNGLPPLPLANLMASALVSVDASQGALPLSSWLIKLADTVERIDPEAAIRHINEDRAVAGFPEVSTGDWIEAELNERRNSYKNCVHACLDRLPASDLLSHLTSAVETTTGDGQRHPPRLIEAVVEDFELSAKPALGKAESAVTSLIQWALSAANGGEAALDPALTQIERFSKEWVHIAHPMQLCAKSRGEAHAASNGLAYQIRGLGVDLANNHGLYGVSQRITKLLQEVFAEVPNVADTASGDVDTLKGLLSQQQQAKADQEKFAREITFRADLGLFTRTRLAISPQGVDWGKQHFPLESIVRVRWGAVRRSVNFIPLGTDYYIAFGSESDIALVHTNRDSIYAPFVASLYRAVSPQIAMSYARGLSAGKIYRFGDIRIADDVCELILHKFIGSERVRVAWSDAHIWSSNGLFVIGHKSNKKIYASASYKDIDNVHVLEQMIRVFFKDPKSSKLSDTFAQ